MSKLRLTNERRDAILDYMMAQYDEKRDKAAETAALDDLIERINATLRVKYPEADMAVLRRYEVTRKDTCLRFAVLDTGRVFDVNFNRDYELLEVVRPRLADIPGAAGCYRSEAFACDQALADAADHWMKLADAARDIRKRKHSEYRTFLYAAKTLDEVEEVVPLPEELRRKLGVANALIALSEDAVAGIKADFAKAA